MFGGATLLLKMEEYEPIKVLGEGSFGKVYLMKHSKTRDLVCTKVRALGGTRGNETCCGKGSAEGSTCVGSAQGGSIVCDSTGASRESVLSVCAAT